MGQSCCAGQSKSAAMHITISEESRAVSRPCCCSSSSHAPKDNAGSSSYSTPNMEKEELVVGKLPVSWINSAPPLSSRSGDTAASNARLPSARLDEILGIQAEAGKSKMETKQVIKTWVKAMIKGMEVNVMTPDGTEMVCDVSLNRTLDTLVISRHGQKRNVTLSEINVITAGDKVNGLENMPLTENCATMSMGDYTSITFLFETIEERDTFVMCMGLFVERAKEE